MISVDDAKATILLVDDTPENLTALEAVLGELGEVLAVASSGHEALRYLLEHEVAVILLDVQMPGLDGFEAAQLIRQRERLKDIPIIFLTAIHRTEEFAEAGYKVGGIDYIFKPFNTTILKAKVSLFVELYKRRIREKHIEEERLALFKAKSRLVDELADNKRELTKANEHLSIVNREMEAFSYSVSHDLRAPLRHISGFVELLRKSESKLDSNQQNCLSHIADAAAKMDILIEDLLNFSRLGRAEMRTVEVDMHRLVLDVQRELMERVQNRNIQWKIETLDPVNADPSLLRVVVSNLMSNAVKYTGKREEATIEIGSMRREDEKDIVFFVRDNGAGFDMNYAEKLFGVFQRLHTDGEFEGTGIGLATVRRIITRHGGRTWAEGKPNEGATFYFSLPVK